MEEILIAIGLVILSAALCMMTRVVMAAKRNELVPHLSHTLTVNDQGLIELSIVTLTNAAAIRVRVSISQLPSPLSDVKNLMPIAVPMIGPDHPFKMALTTFRDPTKQIPRGTVLCVRYHHPLTGAIYDYRADLSESAPRVYWGNPTCDQDDPRLEDIAQALCDIRDNVQSVVRHQFSKECPSQRRDDSFDLAT